MNEKRGISAVVAVVLIILITVAAVVIIWAAIIPLINQNLSSLDFDGRIIVLTSNGYTSYDSLNDKLSVQLKNENSENIVKARIIIYSDTGETFNDIVDAPYPNQVRTYVYENISDVILGTPISVGVAPLLYNKNNLKEGPETSKVSFGKGTIEEEGEVFGSEAYNVEPVGSRGKGSSGGPSGRGRDNTDGESNSGGTGDGTGTGDSGSGDGTGSQEICLVDSDCGESYYSEVRSCVVGKIYRDLVTPICVTSDEPNSCGETRNSVLTETCQSGSICFNGACVSQVSDGMCSINSDCGLAFNNTDYSCVAGDVYITQSSPVCSGSSPNKLCEITNNSVIYQDCKGLGCVDGVCLLSELDACTLDSHCGQQYNSSNFCVAGNVYRNVNTPSCLGNPRSCDVLVDSVLVETCNFGCNSGTCIIPEENQDDYLVAYWKFDEGSGISASDFSGNGHNCFVSSESLWVSPGANYDSDYSLLFGSSSGFVRTFSYSPLLDISNEITIEAWVNPIDNSGLRTIVNNWDGSSYYLGINEGRVRFNIGTAESYVAESNSLVPIDVWTKIRATYDGSQLRIYINDVLDKSVSYSGFIGTSQNPVKIGSLAGTSENYIFSGKIDEVKIWNKSFAP